MSVDPPTKRMYKSKKLAFLLWLPPMGILGAHHYYLGQYRRAVIHTLTFGWLLVGWLVDAVLMDAYVRKTNERIFNARQLPEVEITPPTPSGSVSGTVAPLVRVTVAPTHSSSASTASATPTPTPTTPPPPPTTTTTAGQSTAPEQLSSVLSYAGRGGLDSTPSSISMSGTQQSLPNTHVHPAGQLKVPQRGESVRCFVIGCGRFGPRIGLELARCGHHIAMFDVVQERADETPAKMAQMCDELIDMGLLSRIRKDSLLRNVTVARSMQDMKGSDVVIEVVFEDFAVKQRVLREADSITGAATTILSSTISCDVDDLADGLLFPQRMMCGRFLLPVLFINKVEIVPGTLTSIFTQDWVRAFVESMGKHTFLHRRGPHLVLSPADVTALYEVERQQMAERVQYENEHPDEYVEFARTSAHSSQTNVLNTPPALHFHTLGTGDDGTAESIVSEDEAGAAWIAARGHTANVSAALRFLSAEPDAAMHPIQSELTKPHMIPLNELNLREVVGHGSFGVVYKGHYRQQTVAAKQLHRHIGEREAQMFAREIQILSSMRCPHIVLFMGVCVTETDIYLVTEFMHKGSLHDVLVNCKQSAVAQQQLNVARRVTMLADLARGMSHLHMHDPPLLHRDLTSYNILVDGDYRCKVADFGLSRPQHESMTLTPGNLRWMAPEVYQEQNYDTHADVFSFALIAWEMFAEQEPLADMMPARAAGAMANQGVRPSMDTIKETCPTSLQTLIQQCWAHEPEQRPSFAQIAESLCRIEESLSITVTIND